MLLFLPASAHSKSPLRNYLASRENIINVLVDSARNYYPPDKVNRDWTTGYMQAIAYELGIVRSKYKNFNYKISISAYDEKSNYVDIATRIQFLGDEGFTVEILTYFDKNWILLRKRVIGNDKPEIWEYVEHDIIGRYIIPQLDHRTEE